jgi:enoyl-CoA hydratase/carnithine racemase
VRDGGGQWSLRIYESLKPVIAACNGAAIGIGSSMQLAMDIRLASTEARYGFVFTRRGIAPEGCSSWFLPRIVGTAQAQEWMLTGRIIPAEEALARGLVKALYPPEELMPAARALAKEIAQNTAPVSVALTRQMLWRLPNYDHPMEAHKVESRVVYSRGRCGDAAEGVSSFLEKRPAHYPDRVSRDLPTDIFPWWAGQPY